VTTPGIDPAPGTESPPPGPPVSTAEESPVAGPNLGPEVRLELVRPLLAALLAPVVTGLIAWPVLRAIAPGQERVIPLAMGAAGAAFVVGVLVLQPWRTRPVVQWMQWWMATLGVCFLATVALGAVLLYSSPHDERAALGVLIAVGHFITLMAVSVVVASLIRTRCAASLAASRDSSPST